MTIIRTEKELRPRNDRDFYPTQPELVRAALKLIHPDLRPARVLDPGCGLGVWGEGVKTRYSEAEVWGIDIEPPDQAPPAAYTRTIEADFLAHDFGDTRFRLVVGNPPYKYAEAFVRKSWDLLEQPGWMIFLLRMNFLASRKRTNGLFKDIKPNYIYILSTRPSFTGDNRCDDNEYALFVWNKADERRLTNVALHWYDWKAGFIL